MTSQSKMETHAPVFVRAKLDSIRTCMFSIYEQPPQRNCASRNQERASSYDDHHRHHRHHRHHSLPRRKNGEWMTREALLVPAEFVEGRSLNTLCNNLQHCVKAACNTVCNNLAQCSLELHCAMWEMLFVHFKQHIEPKRRVH